MEERFQERLLYDYQSPEMVLLARSCEDRWMATYPEWVLDHDCFAHWLGQGKQLRKLLRLRLGQLNKQGLPDNTTPTLTERLDHLES